MLPAACGTELGHPRNGDLSEIEQYPGCGAVPAAKRRKNAAHSRILADVCGRVFRPVGASPFFVTDPRLAPCAAFFRRFAASLFRPLTYIAREERPGAVTTITLSR